MAKLPSEGISSRVVSVIQEGKPGLCNPTARRERANFHFSGQKAFRK